MIRDRCFGARWACSTVGTPEECLLIRPSLRYLNKLIALNIIRLLQLTTSARLLNGVSGDSGAFRFGMKDAAEESGETDSEQPSASPKECVMHR